MCYIDQINIEQAYYPHLRLFAVSCGGLEFSHAALLLLTIIYHIEKSVRKTRQTRMP